MKITLDNGQTWEPDAETAAKIAAMRVPTLAERFPVGARVRVRADAVMTVERVDEKDGSVYVAWPGSINTDRCQWINANCLELVTESPTPMTPKEDDPVWVQARVLRHDLLRDGYLIEPLGWYDVDEASGNPWISTENVKPRTEAQP